MLNAGTATHQDLGVGFRCSARFPPELFQQPLDTIQAALPEELQKASVKKRVGSIQIEHSERYVVCTARREDTPLCRGRILVKVAPGGLVDHCMIQEERGITSMRCLWQSILDQELTLMAQATALLQKCGVVHRTLKQLRVDSVLSLIHI